MDLALWTIVFVLIAGLVIAALTFLFDTLAFLIIDG